MRRFTKPTILTLALVGTAMPAQAIDTAPVPEEIPIGLLVDLSTGQTLFAREPDRRFVPASVTKVMTAYTGFKLVDEGKLRLEMPFLYTQALEDAWYNEGSNMFLRAGERPTIGQLLLGITTVSGNDASVALAEASTGSLDNWLALMNANARDLGMRNTHFGSPNGFPDGGATYTTANDLVLLGSAMTRDYPGLYRRFFGHRTLRWREITQANHDPVTGRVDGADGMKTGYTNEAGFTFLGTAERDGRRLMMVLAASPDGRMRDKAARDLLEWGFDAFEQRMILPADTVVGTAQVQDGSDRQVELRTADNVTVALPRDGGRHRMSAELVYRGPVAAPFAAGDEIARLRLSIDGRETLSVPLVAGRDVRKANVLQRVGNAFARWMG